MKHELIELPYSYDALVPFMSRETLEYHHGKHHQTYVNKLNDLIVGTPFEELSLEEIVLKSDGAIFNNAAQILNHNIFFLGLKQAQTEPSEKVKILISDAFGSFEAFKKAFLDKATTHFGSGWVWLVQNDHGTLEIVATANAQSPITDGLKPLLVVDVWEHAYYIDYRNVRPEYLDNWWAIINWDAVNAKLA